MNEDIQYKLHGISELSFQVYKKPKDFREDTFDFKLVIHQKVNEEKGLVVVVVEVGISQQEETLLLAEYEIAVGFEVIDFAKHITKNDKGVFVVPEALGFITNTISISTVRGYLYSQLKGTYLHKAIMPIITELKPIPPTT